MTSTRFCGLCGAANDETSVHCFACEHLLSAETQEPGNEKRALLHTRYRLGATLGIGGYSSVVRGWDTQPHEREVAIKRINLEGLMAEETIEATSTYNREIEALSKLEHPQIPRLYDAFADAKHWYLVLEYIKGQTLEAFISLREARRKPFDLLEILDIGLQLCTVLDYLHSRQPPLIFRDLKPGNIMLTPEGKLYLIDFGIARRYTPGQRRDTQSLGSPGYAAPEQYGHAQTDVRTDIYSLGALLRYLLTGHDPSEGLPALRPSRLAGKAGNTELESLIEHMLAADPGDRPSSALQITRQLESVRQLVLGDQQATSIWQPPTPQNYTPATATASLASAQIYLQHATTSQPGLAAVLASNASLAPARRKWLTRRNVLVGLGVGTLAATTGIVLGIRQTQTTTSGQTVYTYRGHSSAVNSISWSLDSQYLASASDDQTAQTWNALTGSQLNFPLSAGTSIHSIAYTVDNTYAIGCADASLRVINTSDSILFSLKTTSAVNSVAWSAGGLYLASADTTVTVWDIELHTGSSPASIESTPLISYKPLAWSPDGRVIFSSASDASVVYSWQISSMNEVHTIYAGHTEPITCIACSPDGTYIAAGSQDSSIILWDATSASINMNLNIPSGQIRALSWSPNNQYLASASDDGLVRVWSCSDGSIVLTYSGHTGPVYTVAWSPDGQYIASAGEDTTVQVWRAP